MKFFWFLILIPLLSHAGVKKIFIDPGHGGIDKGAVYSGIKESEIVLSISKKLHDLLAQHPNIKVHMSRDRDQSLGLNERVQAAQDLDADLIVSVHANAAGDFRARGVELYLQNSLPIEEEMLFLAHQESQLIQKSHQNESLVLSKSQDVAAILEDLQRQDKFMQSLSFSEILKNTWREVKPRTPLSIKQAPFFILSQSQIPSVLVEVGFLSHPRESQQLKNPQYQNEIAVIIQKGILRYLKQDPKGISEYKAL